MSTIQSLVASANFPLVIVSVGFVVSGFVMLGVSAIVSLRTRTDRTE